MTDNQPTQEQIKRKEKWDKAISKFLLSKAGYSETIWKVINDSTKKS